MTSVLEVQETQMMQQWGFQTQLSSDVVQAEPDPPLIDLVAVAYNAPEETDKFLESLFDIDIPFTLTVIDNNSPDVRIKPLLRSAYNSVANHQLFRGGNLVFNEENVGYARACNQGAYAGTAPYIGLLNCDVQWKMGVGKQLVEAFQLSPEHGEVAIVGPKTVTSVTSPLDRPKLTHSGIVVAPSGRDEHRYWMQTDRGQADDVLCVPTVSGATYFVRRSAWWELTLCSKYLQVAPGAEGAFLPTSHFYEETWCSYHARAHGYDVVYRGDICMVHEWHRSSPVGSKKLDEAEAYFRQACAAHGIELKW